MFIAAAYLERHPPGWLKSLPGRAGFEGRALAGGGTFLLPMVIATVRKLEALGLLIAETKVTAAAAGEHTAAIRAVVAQGVPVAGTVVLGLFVLVLSSALLPSFSVLVALIAVVALIGRTHQKAFIRIYSKAQGALYETLARIP